MFIDKLIEHICQYKKMKHPEILKSLVEIIKERGFMTHSDMLVLEIHGINLESATMTLYDIKRKEFMELVNSQKVTYEYFIMIFSALAYDSAMAEEMIRDPNFARAMIAYDDLHEERFGLIIERTRKENEILIEEIAEFSDLSIDDIEDIEADEFDLGFDTAVLIAEGLGRKLVIL